MTLQQDSDIFDSVEDIYRYIEAAGTYPDHHVWLTLSLRRLSLTTSIQFDSPLNAYQWARAVADCLRSRDYGGLLELLTEENELKRDLVDDAKNLFQSKLIQASFNHVVPAEEYQSQPANDCENQPCTSGDDGD